MPPNATVYYRVGDPARGWSAERSFRSAPLAGPGALPYRLGLVGDLGQTDHSLRWEAAPGLLPAVRHPVALVKGWWCL